METPPVSEVGRLETLAVRLVGRLLTGRVVGMLEGTLVGMLTEVGIADGRTGGSAGIEVGRADGRAAGFEYYV